MGSLFGEKPTPNPCPKGRGTKLSFNLLIFITLGKDE